jgi:hypothetical protein
MRDWGDIRDWGDMREWGDMRDCVDMRDMRRGEKRDLRDKILNTYLGCTRREHVHDRRKHSHL